MLKIILIDNLRVVFVADVLFHLQAEKPAAKKRKVPEDAKKKAEKKKKEEKASRKEENVSKKEEKVSRKEEKSTKKEKPVKHVGVYSGVREN